MVMASNITFHVVRPEKGLIIPFSGPLSLSFPYMLFSTATMKLESNSITFFTLFLKGNRTSSCLLVCLKIESALILFFLLTWINAKEYIENRNNFLWFFSHAVLVKEVKVYTIVNKHYSQKRPKNASLQICLSRLFYASSAFVFIWF